MSTSHDLRLSIDAAPAKRGAKEFTAAITAVKRAVRDLDRDTQGVFEKLKAGPQTSVSPTRTPAAVQMTAVSNAARTAEKDINALQRRLSRVGDTQGIKTADAALSRFNEELKESVKTSADLRAAQDRFKGSIFPVQEAAKQATEMERLQAAYGRVVAQIDDAGPAQLAYQRGVTATERMHRQGAISTEEYRQTLDRLEAQYLSTSNAALSAEARQRRFLGSMAGWHGHGGMARQLGLQINQMGQVAGMATSTEQALKSMSYQAADIGLVFGGMGMAIGTVAGVALPLLIDRLFAAENRGKALEGSLDSLEGSLGAYQAATRLARSSTAELRREFGSLTESVRDSIDALAEHELANAVRDLKGTASNAGKAYRDLFRDIAAYDAENANPLDMASVELQRRAMESAHALKLNVDEARALRDALDGLSRVSGGPEEVRAAFGEVAALLSRLYPSFQDMPEPIQQLHYALVQADITAAKLIATQDGSADASDRAASATSGLNVELTTAADLSAALLANLNGVPSALSALGGSVSDQIGAMQAQNRALTLELERGMSSAGAARAVQLEQMVKAAQNGGPINFDQVAGATKDIRELDRLAKQQEALRERLREANRDPRKGRGGGGAGDDWAEQAQRTIATLERQNAAQRLLTQGVVETSEAAQILAEAQARGSSMADQQTAALVRQAEQAGRTREELQRLANDPVQAYLDALPTIQEAGRQIRASMLQTMEDGLTDVLSGEFDAEKIAKNIQRTLARALSQQVMASIAPGLASGLGGGVVRGSQQGAMMMQSAILTAGAQHAAMVRAATTGAAIPSTGTAAGGGGNWLTSAASFIFGMFEEGGYSNAPVGYARMPLAAFADAPRFSEGTPNTSGIPAVLHPNEAVVPLSRGRKIPVELGDRGKSGDIHQTVNVTVESTTDDPNEQGEAIATKIRQSLENMVDAKIVEQLRYGGSLNPRT